jgi:serine/threonine protein kinase
MKGPEDSPEAGASAGRNPVDELLLEALESMTTGDEAIVERLCAEHPELASELRERVEVLREMQLLPSDAAAMAFPERLGEFRLVRRLGGGGMGVVYEALQEPLGRTVALKLIRPEHLYFDRSRERFRRETEAVARLAHPGIVTIHTVGEAQGAPYFAMEMIQGATLDQALEQVAGLAPDSLLGSDLRAAVSSVAANTEGEDPEHADELFSGSWIDACTRIALRMSEALAHAHSRGVLHRDIKPSNIAVTLEGRVVLLDFGLAALDDNLRMTSAGATLGSVLYMSPEQLAGRSDEIDARTDVYALGVTLYELLALEPPFARADSTQTRAAILEGRPPAIRARCHAVPRDLEIVCLHAMEHDRARRYPSMEAFGADLRAVLEGRPISARPPSATYRARRWIQRHPARSTAIALGALLVSALPSALYLQQRANSAALERALEAEKEASTRAAASERSARLEAGEAEQVASFLVELFAASDPYSAGRRDVSAAEMLDHGLQRVEEELAGQPELQARLLERIGESYTHLDEYAQALVPLERALELRRELHGDRDTRTAATKVLLASAARLAARPDSEALLRSALEVLDADPEADKAHASNARLLLAMCRTDANDAREALELLSRVRSELDDAQEPGSARRWTVLAMTASAQRQLGQPEAAEATAREALELDRETPTLNNPWRAAALEALALSLAEQDRIDESLTVFERLMPEAHAIYGDGNPVFASMQLSYLGVLQDAGRHEGLAEQLDELTRALEGTFGASHSKALRAVDRLATALAREGRFDEACANLEYALLAHSARVGPDDAWIGTLNYRLGAVLTAKGDFAGALAPLQRAQELVANMDEASRAAADLGLARVLLVDATTRAQAHELAARWLERGPQFVRLLAAYFRALAHRLDARPEEAERQLERALASNVAPRGAWMETASRELLAELRIARGELEPSCDVLWKQLERLELALGEHHIEFREARERIESAQLAARCGRAGPSEPPASKR